MKKIIGGIMDLPPGNCILTCTFGNNNYACGSSVGDCKRTETSIQCDGGTVYPCDGPHGT